MRPFSDVDLAIDAGAPLSLETLANLRDAFEASDLPYAVDLTDLTSLDVGLRARALANASCIHGPRPAR